MINGIPKRWNPRISTEVSVELVKHSLMIVAGRGEDACPMSHGRRNHSAHREANIRPNVLMIINFCSAFYKYVECQWALFAILSHVRSSILLTCSQFTFIYTFLLMPYEIAPGWDRWTSIAQKHRHHRSEIGPSTLFSHDFLRRGDNVHILHEKYMKKLTSFIKWLRFKNFSITFS